MVYGSDWQLPQDGFNAQCTFHADWLLLYCQVSQCLPGLDQITFHPIACFGTPLKRHFVSTFFAFFSPCSSPLQPRNYYYLRPSNPTILYRNHFNSDRSVPQPCLTHLEFRHVGSCKASTTIGLWRLLTKSTNHIRIVKPVAPLYLAFGWIFDCRVNIVGNA